MTAIDESPDVRPHIIMELGLVIARDGDGLKGSALITPEMHVPGAPVLRTSVLAAWVDHLAGMLAVEVTAPQVPVTLDLDVQLYRPGPFSGQVHGASRAVKVGRSVFVASVEFTTDDGEPLGFGTASFMSSRDPGATMPTKLSLEAPMVARRLSVPLAERAGCERTGVGVATLSRSDDGLNAANTVNGGLIALVAEEAALSLVPGTTLSSLSLRYLQPVRIGPVVATATHRSGLGRVEVRDQGSDSRLSAVATTREFGK
jgi:acyl-coenzyme A thioesterase PaaI-like protein